MAVHCNGKSLQVRAILSPSKPTARESTFQLMPSGSLCSADFSGGRPQYPTLRANPFPEVTDPICRLPLPTLFCRLEAVHLGDLLRILVRPGTRFTLLRGVFKGRWKRAGHRKSRGALRNICPYLGSNPFQGACSLQRKENSSRGFRRRPPLRLRYRTRSLRTDLRVRVTEY